MSLRGAIKLTCIRYYDAWFNHSLQRVEGKIRNKQPSARGKIDHCRALVDGNRMAGPSVRYGWSTACRHQRRSRRLRSMRTFRSVPATDVARKSTSRHDLTAARRRNAPTTTCIVAVLVAGSAEYYRTDRRSDVHGLSLWRRNQLAAELHQ